MPKSKSSPVTRSVAGGSIAAFPVPNCPGGGQYVHGTVVRLAAAPSPGYGFSSWSGNISATANPVYVNVDTIKAVTANFTVTNTWTLWYGSASITSDRTVVAVGRPHIGSEVTSYDGFASGSLTCYVPMLFKNAWSSYDSALYIQNVDSNPHPLCARHSKVLRQHWYRELH